MFRAYAFHRSQPAREPPSSHPEGQVFVLTHGGVTFYTQRRRWVMSPGRLCWLPPGIVHGFVSTGPVAGVSLKVAGGDCAGLPGDAHVLDPDPFYAHALRRLIARPADFEALWGLLKRAIGEAPQDRLTLASPVSPALARLAEGLTRAPRDTRTLGQWAAAIGVSERTLMRRLKAETGLSFAVWRQRLRLIHATGAMQSGASATTAALDAGFGSASAFSAAFRKHMGEAPTTYLKL